MYSDTKTNGGKGRGRFWLCKCDCGGEKIASAYNLRRGHVKSCGCLPKRNAYELSQHNRTHNMSNTRLYKCYHAMLKRCKYEPRWAGRGIKVCDEWKNDPEAFINWSLVHGYADNLSLDRIDVNGNYEPSNCRWADRITQANNTTKNVYFTIEGITHTAAEWSKICGVSSATIRKRAEHGFKGKELIVPTGSIYRTNYNRRTHYKNI